MIPFKRILVATDLHETSEPAVEAAIEMAKAFDAALTLVHVFEGPAFPVGELPVWEVARENAEDALERVLARVCLSVPRATATLRSGAAWTEILAAAEEAQADVLVVGTHGRRGLSHALLGSIAERLVQRSPISVLVVGSPSAAAGRVVPSVQERGAVAPG